jgi:hypothetical protein
MILVPLFDLKFLNELLQLLQELQIGGTRAVSATDNKACGLGDAMSDLAIYDGQTRMGSIVGGATNCHAKDVNGNSLGKFDDRKAAAAAIATHYTSGGLIGTNKPMNSNPRPATPRKAMAKKVKMAILASSADDSLSVIRRLECDEDKARSETERGQMAKPASRAIKKKAAR